MSLHKQVSKAIRILSWDRDVSARASHLADLTIQAEFENVSGSTTERKIMSTKTSFKRIALVAVAALSLGGLTAVSSSAVGFSDSMTLTNATSTAVIGTPVTDTVTASFIAAAANDSMTASVSVISVPSASTTGGFVTVWDTQTPRFTNDSGTVSGLKLTVQPAASATGRATGSAVISFTPDVVGTFVVKVTPAIAQGTAASAALTWTITVAAPTYDHSVVSLRAATGSFDATIADMTTASAAASSTSTTAVAQINVGQYSTTDTTTLLGSDYTKAMTITLSGTGGALGLEGTSSAIRTNSIIVAAETQNTAWAKLYPTGTPGTAVITVAVGGVTVATKSFVFSGPVSQYVLGTPSKTNIGVSETGTVVFTGADSAASVTADPGSVYAFSSDSTVATAVSTTGSSTKTETVTVTGVKAGTATITVGNASTLAASTITKSFTVSITKTTAASVTVTFDKDAYLPGEKMTITVSAKDANNAAVADGSRALFATGGLTSNIALTTPTFDTSTSIALVAGVATYTAYAPAYGTITLTATEGAAVDNVIAGGTAKTITATATIANAAADAAQAAIDAAQEATDAANAAYDAANNAMDSADAATAAAQDASDNAAAALAAVTSLSATVAKLVKSVAAIAAALAKVQKKLGA